MIYGYLVCKASVAASAPRPRGLGDATVRTVEKGGLVAFYSRHRSLDPRPSRKALLTHERVVDAVMVHGAVLPLRFGTQVSNESRLAAVLTERRTEFLEILDQLEGCVEIGVRVNTQNAPPPQNREEDGRSYLLTRVRKHQEAQRAAEEIHHPLKAVAVASTTMRPQPPAILTAAYLIDRQRTHSFQATAEDLAAKRPHLQVVVTGPWPPYSFASTSQDAP